LKTAKAKIQNYKIDKKFDKIIVQYWLIIIQCQSVLLNYIKICGLSFNAGKGQKILLNLAKLSLKFHQTFIQFKWLVEKLATVAC
jgi:hypothetical protein